MSTIQVDSFVDFFQTFKIRYLNLLAHLLIIFQSIISNVSS